MPALDPRGSVGAALRLALGVHRIGPRSGRAARVAALEAGLGSAPARAACAPAAVSGGQRQRAAIARALACKARLLLLDEPTSCCSER